MSEKQTTKGPDTAGPRKYRQVADYVSIERIEKGASLYLTDLWTMVWLKRRIVTLVTVGAAIISLAVTFLLPNVYRAEIVLAPVSVDGGQTGALSALSGVGSLIGVPLPSSGDTEENLAILKSRAFLWRFIDEKNLMPVLFATDWDETTDKWRKSDVSKQPTRWDAYRIFADKVLNIRTDPASGLIYLSAEWTDPQAASNWANELISRLNQYLRERAIDRSEKNLGYLYKELEKGQVTEIRTTLYQLIEKEQRDAMLANTSEEFAFRVVDPSVAPDKKVRPKRLFIALMTAFLAFVICVFTLFVRGAADRPT